MAKFEKIIRVSPPYDKRHSDPKKNYGIGGMSLRFILKGTKGATQFVFLTGQYQKHVADELATKYDGRYNSFHGRGADIGYHSPVPHYEGQSICQNDCEVLGGPCYYDGSSLQAGDFEETFLREGEPAVWAMLEERYHEIFDA